MIRFSSSAILFLDPLGLVTRVVYDILSVIQLAKRRGINVSSDDVDLQEWKNDTDEDHSQPLSQGGQMDEQDVEQDEIQEQMDSSVVSSCQVMKKEGSPPDPKKQNEEDSYAQETLESQAKLLYSENEEDLLLPAVYFRKFMSQLSQSANPPISSFMELNILPRFVQLLSIAKDPKLHVRLYATMYD